MIIGCHFTKTRIFSTYLENFICYFVGLKNADCNSLEKVQEKFVKNVRGLRTTDYRDRLRELGILTLVDRRQYLDLVEVFKIIKGFNNVCRSDYFTLQGDVDRPTTRGSVFPLNIVHPRSNLEIRRHFFIIRVVEHWNALPNETSKYNCTYMSHIPLFSSSFW